MSRDYQILQSTRLRLSEVLITYFVWWVVMPLMAAAAPFLALTLVDGKHLSEVASVVLVIASVCGAALLPWAVFTLANRVRQLPF